MHRASRSSTAPARLAMIAGSVPAAAAAGPASSQTAPSSKKPASISLRFMANYPRFATPTPRDRAGHSRPAACRSCCIPAIRTCRRSTPIFRFLTHGRKEWFGGGSDLTPFYPFREDVVHFHRTWRAVCERHPDVADYRRFKDECDRTSFYRTGSEARGVGGIFFDTLDRSPERTFNFVRDCGESILGGLFADCRTPARLRLWPAQAHFQASAGGDMWSSI